MGGSGDACTAQCAGPLFEGKTPSGTAPLSLSSRNGGNRQSGSSIESGRGSSPPVRVQSPFHTRRCSGLVGQTRPHPRLCHSGRGPGNLLSPPPCRPGSQTGDYPRRRSGSCFVTAQGIRQVCPPDGRQHGGDHHRGHPPAGIGRGGGAEASRNCRKRCGDQAPLR